jgi:hypothetical protein
MGEDEREPRRLPSSSLLVLVLVLVLVLLVLVLVRAQRPRPRWDKTTTISKKADPMRSSRTKHHY